MPPEELKQELAQGVVFWVAEEEGRLLGVMGIQDKGEFALVRHACVSPSTQRKGAGTKLLRHVESLAGKPVLIGTWADAALTLHAAVVAFVVGGLVLVLIGNLRNWQWVNVFWLRLAHLLAIAFVAAEAGMGASRPLTRLEMWLRAQARATAYSGSFVEHWLQRALYYDAPSWVFALGYGNGNSH